MEREPWECDRERASMMQREPSDLRGMTERGWWWKSEVSSTAKMAAAELVR